jgi:hypothetical protein
MDKLPSGLHWGVLQEAQLARLYPLKTFFLECISDMLNHQVQLSDSKQ